MPRSFDPIWEWKVDYYSFSKQTSLGCLLAPGPGLALGEQGPAPCFTKCSSSKGPWRVHTEMGIRLETGGCQGKVNGSDTFGGLHGGGGPELQDKRGDVWDQAPWACIQQMLPKCSLCPGHCMGLRGTGHQYGDRKLGLKSENPTLGKLP